MRKTQVVTSALESDIDLAITLGIEPGDPGQAVHGWIVDTSIEHDHKYFRDFLKVSLEEV